VTALAPTSLSPEFREALALAAIAAFLVSFAVVEADYQRRRSDRATARSIVGSAARQLRAVILGEPDVEHLLRLVTLGGVGDGERIALGGGPSLRAPLERLHGTLEKARGAFATTIGTQMPFVEPTDQRLAVRALSGLDAAIINSTKGADAAWRHEVLFTRGIRADALESFNQARVRPTIDAVHRALADVAHAAARLSEGIAAPGMLYRTNSPDVERAARAVGRCVIDNAVAHGVAINWWPHSSIRGTAEITMRTLANLDDLAFDDAVQDNGWSSLTEALREEARFVQESLGVVARDLPGEAVTAIGDVGDAIEAAQRGAHDAGEAARSLLDARVKQLATDEVAEADRRFANARRAFLEQVGRVVAAADNASQVL